jgi:hypothetical protein
MQWFTDRLLPAGAINRITPVFRTILHANNGSDGAFQALSTALHIASGNDAELHMISVGEVPYIADTINEVRGEKGRSSRQGRSLAGCKSPYRQLPVVGRLAYPMRGEVTNRVLLGRKSPGCPAGVFAAVGTIWGASKLGGRNITKYLQPRKSPRTESFQAGKCGKPTQFSFGEGRWHRGRNRREHTVYRRGRGSSIQAQTVGDNVGRLPWAAGTGNNLQGLSKRGQKPKEERANGSGA